MGYLLNKARISFSERFGQLFLIQKNELKNLPLKSDELTHRPLFLRGHGARTTVSAELGEQGGDPPLTQ